MKTDGAFADIMRRRHSFTAGQFFVGHPLIQNLYPGGILAQLNRCVGASVCMVTITTICIKGSNRRTRCDRGITLY